MESVNQSGIAAHTLARRLRVLAFDLAAPPGFTVFGARGALVALVPDLAGFAVSALGLALVGEFAFIGAVLDRKSVV